MSVWASLAVGLLARPWARWGAGFALVALTITLFILNLRRRAEQLKRQAGLTKPADEQYHSDI